MAANDKQVGGKHYQAKIQHWDWVWSNDLDYFQGQITKYVARWKHKGGIEDLEKARHFLDKYIELVHADEMDSANARLNAVPDLEEGIYRREEGRARLDRWVGYTFEGVTGPMGEGRVLYKCVKCGQEVWVRENEAPWMVHLGCAEHKSSPQGSRDSAP